MKLIVDISEDVYTRLFDNGIQDNEIAVDDVCEMARALRHGTPLETHDEEVIKETVESIWGKPPYTEVLDKIRAEILVLDDADYDYDGYYKAVTDALAIIDKYKEESEEQP